MATRPRNREYRYLPDFLNFDKDRKRYILTLISGKRKTIGKDRAYAIAVAKEYNSRMRQECIVNLDSIIRELGGIKGEALPFSEHIDHLMERIILDENPAQSTLADWTNDTSRIKEYFSDIPACDITLENVNGFVNFYHSESSANVQNRKVLFLKKLFSYAIDESLMFDNPATRKKMRRIDKKQRRRLSFNDYMKIRNAADLWLKTAMDLAL